MASPEIICMRATTATLNYKLSEALPSDRIHRQTFIIHTSVQVHTLGVSHQLLYVGVGTAVSTEDVDYLPKLIPVQLSINLLPVVVDPLVQVAVGGVQHQEHAAL